MRRNLFKEMRDTWRANTQRQLQPTGKVWSSDDLVREQARGLFVLGLLAVLVVFESPKMLSFLAGSNNSGLPLISVSTELGYLFGFWCLYVFFMVVSISEDLLPKSVCLMSKKVGHLFLFAAVAEFSVLSVLLQVGEFFHIGDSILLFASAGLLVIVIYLLDRSRKR